MELKERLVYCNTCEKKKFDFKAGVLCGITELKPNFVGTCESYEMSYLEKEKINAKEYTKKLNNEENDFKKELSNSNKNQLKIVSANFIKELKESESENQLLSQKTSNPSSWKIVLSVIITIVALIRLIMIFV